MTFKGSSFAADLQDEIDEHTKRTQYEADCAFNSMNELYEMQIEKKNNAIQSVSVNEKKKQKSQVMVNYLFSLKSAIEHLVMKLKQAIQSNQELLRKVQGNVRVPSTREVLNNPFNMSGVSALCGMFLILFREFMKPQLALFTQQMITLNALHYSKEQCKNDIEGVLQNFGENIIFWQNSNLFSFMTIDNFFTMRFLLSLDKDSELRAECMKEIMTYMRKQHTEYLTVDDKKPDSEDQDGLQLAHEQLTYTDMPMFSHLVNSIKHGVVKRQELEQETDRQTQAARQQPVPHKDFRQNKFTKFQKPPVVERGLELAMNASTTTSNPQGTKKSSSLANYPTSIPNGYQLLPTNGDLYSRKVVCNEKLCYLIPKTNTYGSYTSTDQPCATCSDQDTSNYHTIRCYLGACAKCLYYGHVQNVCRQKNKKPSTAHAAELPMSSNH